jgi:hypothetical protein
MTEREAIRKLDAINPGGLSCSYADADNGHRDADQVLLDFLRAHGVGRVADAWEAARERCWFNYG